ncbi:MAG: cation transport regulator ChaC [Saprospiraceae bacterium]|jgi:cation transport regulator ChaC
MDVPACYYFAYGSNMNTARVRQRQMGVDAQMSAQLLGYALAFNKRSQKYPGAASANVMVSTETSVVEGIAYRLKTADQIHIMDPFEGYPRLYTRIALPVQTVAGSVMAWTYIANVEHVAEGLKPARWYLAHLLAGREYLSAGYYAQLAAVVCLPTSDEEPVS